MRITFPSTIIRYISGEFAKTFGLTLAAITAVWVFGSSIVIVRHQWLGPTAFFMVLPQLAVMSLKYTLPLAVLFGASVCFGRMSTDNEIRAMEWNGVHIGWVILPAAAIAVGASLVALWLNHQLAPSARKNIAGIVKANIMDSLQRQLTLAAQGRGAIAYDNVTLDVKGYDSSARTIDGITVIQTGVVPATRERVITRRIEAPRASLAPGRLAGAVPFAVDENVPEEKRRYVTFQFQNGVITEFDPDTTMVTNRFTAPSIAIDLSSLDRDQPSPEAMTSRRLLRYSESAKSPRARNEAMTMLYERYALGLSPIFFVLLAAPTAALVRWKHALTSFLPSLGVVLVIYYPLVAWGKVWGETGRMNPMVGMFAGNFALLLISAVAILLLLRR